MIHCLREMLFTSLCLSAAIGITSIACSEQATLLDLPDEVLFKVLLLVSSPLVLRTVAVCKVFYRLFMLNAHLIPPSMYYEGLLRQGDINHRFPELRILDDMNHFKVMSRWPGDIRSKVEEYVFEQLKSKFVPIMQDRIEQANLDTQSPLAVAAVSKNCLSKYMPRMLLELALSTSLPVTKVLFMFEQEKEILHLTAFKRKANVGLRLQMLSLMIQWLSSIASLQDFGRIALIVECIDFPNGLIMELAVMLGLYDLDKCQPILIEELIEEFPIEFLNHRLEERQVLVAKQIAMQPGLFAQFLSLDHYTFKIIPMDFIALVLVEIARHRVSIVRLHCLPRHITLTLVKMLILGQAPFDALAIDERLHAFYFLRPFKHPIHGLVCNLLVSKNKGSLIRSLSSKELESAASFLSQHASVFPKDLSATLKVYTQYVEPKLHPEDRVLIGRFIHAQLQP